MWPLLTLTLFKIGFCEDSTDFDYFYGGLDWPGVCREGVNQSPIDIENDAVIEIVSDSQYVERIFVGFDGPLF
jgi:hypothetical protein